MRIQHNIMAMNAYRNFSNNTSALSKNLEKLSSGYKINRAGDDAAGLAISEKMRAQISGLAQAQKNAKSGINLVQTAEGSLTEVHDMLNRMVTLAEQSANGTYDDGVDRANLQKEFDQLRSEIDRIADSSNFNGINLLDGSLSTSGKATSAVSGGFADIKGALAAGVDDVKAIKAKSTIIAGQLSKATNAIKDGDTFTLSLGMSDGSKKEFSVTAKVDKDNVTTFVDQDGNELATTVAAVSGAAGKLNDAVINTALKEAIEASEFGKDYTVSATGASRKITIEAKVAGAGTAHITTVGTTYKNKAGDAIDVKATAAGKTGIDTANTNAGADAYESLDLSKAVLYDGTNLDKAAFEINGEKFVFVKNGKLDDKAIAALREAGISHYVELADAAGTKAVGGDVKDMVEKIKMATGLDVTQGTTSASGVFTKGSAAGNVHIKLGDGTSSKAGGGLTLQIGDTSDDFNQLTVSVADMHAKALGIADISIGDQKSAQAAVQTIKDAINKVSSTRGDLGAMQNRLDHTINNLSVMQENIQDAEATIRDTDVAEEMMAYTKNNILVQSAQAMLAQANQVPQGVLQLLQ